MFCYNCQESGHIAKECRNEKMQGERKCFNCNGSGHIAADCTEKKRIQIANQCFLNVVSAMNVVTRQ